jgi:uncharacterized membrane protein
LNLTLSFQAVYTAPVLIMSQNRQAEIDYRINIKAELDLLREQEVMQLLQAVELLLQRLSSAERREASS